MIPLSHCAVVERRYPTVHPALFIPQAEGEDFACFVRERDRPRLEKQQLNSMTLLRK